MACFERSPVSLEFSLTASAYRSYRRFRRVDEQILFSMTIENMKHWPMGTARIK